MLFKKLSLVGLLAVVALVAGGFAPKAQAATADELQAQITALLAQIAQLQGGASSSIGCYAFTRDLTDGVSGADVSALQSYLAEKGMFAVAPTGFFGPITKAAVASWQTANGVMPAAGYFGAISRAKYASVCGAPLPPAGDDDDDDDDTSSNVLEGGAGSVADYNLMSSLSNEEVGEDEEDVEVAGLEMEVDEGSDLAFTAVRLVFNEGTGATGDFEDYANEVSIWLDGEEVGRVDADAFNDDNDWTKTVSLDDGAIILADETGELTVALSGVSNLDTADDGDEWNVDFRQIRFEDADGSLISEDPGMAVTTFSFELFAAAASTEFKISDGADENTVNDAHIINVHATDSTDNEDILSFNVEIEGDSDVVLDAIPVNIAVGGAQDNVDEMISGLTLLMDGEEVGTASMADDCNAATGEDADCVAVGTAETYLFDNLDLTLDAGQDYEFLVQADFFGITDTGDLAAGDTVLATFGETQTELASFDAEDESGEDLINGDKTGTVAGTASEVRDIGIIVTFVSADEDISESTGANNDVGTFTLKYRVEAFDGTVFVSATAAPTIGTTILGSQTDATGATLYNITLGGTATVDDASDLVTFSTTGGGTDATGDVELADSEYTEFTLTVARTNDDVGDAGIFQVLLKAIGWDVDTGDAKANTYTFDLDDFKTTPVSLN
ncbi:MAG: peptidoglycan-binding protein [Candidatus Campbellbacteria bacterium]|nr:peptidoglycan-binding protein [Candidatus Campbellbacteria bacterium]